ncbi:hypothetical protein AB0P10_12350 [Streptomyces parvus]|uniref:hypothetical protein n=1 Tax=Streptomyces parvus TaxID=66428 RepID=UPI00342BCB8B
MVRRLSTGDCLAFGLSIDALGPDFGPEALMDTLAEPASLATLVRTAGPRTPQDVWAPEWVETAWTIHST